MVTACLPPVSLCLRSLAALLPSSVSHALLASYYTASAPLPLPSLLPHFTRWLLACLEIVEEGGREAQVCPLTHLATSCELPVCLPRRSCLSGRRLSNLWIVSC